MKIEEKTQVLWTYHSSDFQLDDPDLVIDHKLGKCWKSKEKNFRYRDVLPVFCKKIGTEQFLWCCQQRHCMERTSESIDLVEWKLTIPSADAILFYRWKVWEDLLRSPKNDWTDLFVEDCTQIAADEIESVVLLPLETGWAMSYGPAPVKYPKR